MKIKQLRTGVIGIGIMGRNHVRVLSEVSKLVGISDLDEAQGEKISEEYSVSYFKNYKDLLNQIDAVSIAVPTKFHYKIAMDCINSGIHVLIEKPITSNIAEAKTIIESSIKSNVTVAVGHIERFNPAINIAKGCLKSGEWGKIVSISSKRVSSFPERISDVGVLLDTAIHDIDVINYLLDSKIKSVFGAGRQLIHDKSEDCVNVIMNYENGIIATLESNWLMPFRERKLEIITDTHFISIDYIKQSIKHYRSDSDIEEFPVKYKEPLMLEILDFLDSVLDGSRPLVTAESACQNIEVVELIQDSITKNKVLFNK